MSKFNKLNKDILFLIIVELQDDSKSLFSCLMVNRFWCETVIPILWKNPWCYSSINYKNKDYLLKIIAFYLSDDIKESLTSQGIQLPSILHKSLSFDYLSFCRCICVKTINSIVCIGSAVADNQSLLQREFYDLFMKKFPELKYLDMQSIKNQRYYFPNDKLRFERLYELKCDTSVNSKYFYELAHISQHIQKLIIVNDITTKNLGIIKLIEAQKKLKYFEWKEENGLYGYALDPYKGILLALEKKADIINHLKIRLTHTKFNNGRTLQKVLPKLYKLKSLIIGGFNDLNEEQTKMCIYHDLETFKIYPHDLKAASIIIENNGKNLKEFLIDYCSIYDYYNYENLNEDSLILVRNIHENCPLIENLCLTFSPSKDHFIELEKLLKVCQNLKSLLILMFMHDARTGEKLLKNGEEFLNTLIRSTPTNLREIRLLHDYTFSLEALEEFLGKWKGCALSILTCKPIYKEDNYVKLINKYKNNGVIKEFRCESYMNLVLKTMIDN
ncbi:hypothetical protein RclHR1_01390013 [Rhizophagus clarus]|uniref:F-box domain-containing protein n=1 Tax=Rhizophagus clarus TaxID=94130 RepID=A0A2Z6QB75_9GLOM|nr:hypothetical protein RclHR1_01390013 [Rhizophagus clarus]GET04894.1 hypothetical protein GLOIN_2v1771472 [Rhizophagus clarus]